MLPKHSRSMHLVASDASPSQSTDGALAALRSATRSHHAAIEGLVHLEALRDRTHYARVLQSFDAFLPHWEAAVAAALPPDLANWMRRRSRRRLLRDDMRVLGLEPVADTAPAVALPSAAAALGALYVIEGSALGGQLIAAEVARQPWGARGGAAFFTGWGAATGRMWREFRLLVDADVTTAVQRQQACAAACATFDALASQLRVTLDERLGHVS